MLEGILKRALRAVFGGAADISPSNPLPTEGVSLLGVEFNWAFGVYPILKRGAAVAWDDNIIENATTFLDDETYYLFYHAWQAGVPGIRIGVATAPTPYGPWTKSGANPLLAPGAAGEWDDSDIACAKLIKIGDTYYMFYSGLRTGEYPKWGIGLATAASPAGPWTKYAGNPILDDFGYANGIIQINGTFFLYSAYPIDVDTDNAPVALATAPSVTGPWSEYAANPVIPLGQAGTWRELGFSNDSLLYLDGVVHFFGAGVSQGGFATRRASIGHAFSFDGYSFTFSKGNPIARHEDLRMRNLGQVFPLARPPLFLAYSSYLQIGAATSDIAVSVLSAKGTSFKESGISLIDLATLAASATSALTDCPSLYLGAVNQLAFTVECTYDGAATAGIRVHVRTSKDNVNWDTEDWDTWTPTFTVGETIRQTKHYDTAPAFIKVLIENLDGAKAVTDIEVTAAVGKT